MCEAFDWVLMETKLESNETLQGEDWYVVNLPVFEVQETTGCLCWVVRSSVHVPQYCVSSSACKHKRREE